MIDLLLEGNKIFQENEYKNNKDFYRNLVLGQNPKILWLGCSDSRVTPERITGVNAGDIFVHRNIGNIVPTHDWNFATVTEYAINYLKITDIVVCGHSQCGAIKALDQDIDDAYLSLWINNARAAKDTVDSIEKPAVTEEERKERSCKIEKENIKLQIRHLKEYPLVKKAIKSGIIKIHGLYYNLDDGTLTEILD